MQREILVITRNFPPITGGMEKLMWNVFKSLKQDYVCTVIGPKNSARHVDPPHTTVECDETSNVAFLASATINAWKLTAKQRFSLVIGGSGYVGPICRLLQLGRKMPSLLFVHGLDIVAPNQIYQRLWIPCLRRADTVVTNSANTRRLAEQAGITSPNTVIIYPGVDRPVTATTGLSFRKTLNLENRTMLLSVGRIIKRKGLLEFIERCMPDLVRRFPDLMLVVIGDEPRQAINREPQLVRHIESAIEKEQLSGHVLLLGSADENTVQAAYQAADVFIFPLIDRPGDVEGFGIVAIEAASHGTPTVAFKCGGVADAVVDQQTGFLVEATNYEEMTSTITNALVNDSKAAMSAACVEFSMRLSWDRFGQELRTLVGSTLTDPVRS